MLIHDEYYLIPMTINIIMTPIRKMVIGDMFLRIIYGGGVVLFQDVTNVFVRFFGCFLIVLGDSTFY